MAETPQLRASASSVSSVSSQKPTLSRLSSFRGPRTRKLVAEETAEAKALELRHRDDKVLANLKDPNQDLFDEALPLFNSLPTDSSGANCYGLGGKMLYNGFPDGSVVCWAWGVQGEPEWRRWDHDAAASVTSVAASSDGSLASGCAAGRICYQPADAPRDAPAQSVTIPFFRGCRVIDKQRIGTVALPSEMSTSKDLFGASFRIRWDGEDNLDEVAEELALRILKHYFTVCSLILTTHQQVFGGGDDRPMVIVGTINGALLAYCFSHSSTGPNAAPVEQIFVASPYYVVDGLEASILEDGAALRRLSIDGPPITAMALSCDEPGVVLVATGRSDDDSVSEQSKDPELLQVNLKQVANKKKLSTGLVARYRTLIKSDSSAIGLRSLSTAARAIAGFSKAAFYICDSQLWCWKYGSAPRRMALEATARGIALSDDAQWLATGHSDCAVNLWGPLSQCTQSIDGQLEWIPKRYGAFHSIPVQSVAFRKEEGEGQMLISAGADREVHQLRVGDDRVRPPFVADVRLCNAEAASSEKLNDVCVSGDKQLCCIAVGSVVKVCSFPVLSLKGTFKMLAELKGHDDSILCLTINHPSSDNHYLFSGSSDNTARIWKLHSPTLMQGNAAVEITSEIIGPLVSSVTAICVDRKHSELIFLGLSHGSIEIWEWQKGRKQLQSLEFHQQPVLSLSTNMAKRLVSGSADNTAVVWNNELGDGQSKSNFKLDTVLRSHDGNVNSVFLGHKGRKIVTGSTDTNILFWDIEALDRPQIFKGHQAAVMKSCTSLDMQTVISADQSGIIIEWDVISGSVRRSFHASSGQYVKLDALASLDKIVDVRSVFLVEQDLAAHDAGEEDHHKVHGGRWLLIATSESCCVMRMDVLEYTVRKGHIHHVSCVAMSTDSKAVVSASWDGMLVLWDAVNKTQLMTFKGHMGPVFCCDISEDKRFIFSGSADTTIIVWDTTKAGKKKILTGYHDDPVEALKICPAEQGDTVRFATGSMDHKVNLFGMFEDEPRLLAFYKHHGGIRCVIGPHTAGGYVGMGASNGQIIMWKPEVTRTTAASAEDLKTQLSSISTDADQENPLCLTLDYHQEPITSVYFSVDDHTMLATCEDGEASAWTHVAGSARMRMRKTFTHPGKPAVNVGRFSAQATYADTLLVILGCADKQIYIWDYVSHTIERVLTGHKGEVCDLEISLDSQVLISAAREQRILRWNLVRGTAETQLKGHQDGVVVAEVSHKTQRVVTGAKDNRIIVWNTVGPSAGKQALALLEHTGNVSCLAFSADGNYLLSGSWDTSVALTDLLTPQVIRRFRGHIGAVLGCCIGGEAENVIVSCCRAGRLIRWNIATGKALWNMSLGGPARCLVFRAPGLILVGCDKDFAIQVWDIQGKQTGKQLNHQAEISGLQIADQGRILVSSDRAGNLKFWDAEREEFDAKGPSFTCELMSSGIESISVEGSRLVCSTCEGHVLLFDIDQSVGIMPGAMPQRVWKHHLGRVPCVRLLAHEGQDVKIVTASYDNRVFIHPSREGTALWFSWRPIMNAVRQRDYSLYKLLLLNQEGILHEKVYPCGWTLLHALVELGDLKAIQILFSIAGSEPLGFTLDAEHRTPLDIGLETVQTGILDYLLSEAKKWPKHVLEFSTKSLCKLVPMSLTSMPAFLDSRLFEPLPEYGVPPPTETMMSSNFTATPAQMDYFQAVGMGPSLVPSMSAEQYTSFGIASFKHIAPKLEDSGHEHEDDYKAHHHKDIPCHVRLQRFLQGLCWMCAITGVILMDVVVTLIGILAGMDESDTGMMLIGYAILAAFTVDIVLRILAYRSEFFVGADRYMNMFELGIVIFCIVLEVTDSSIPISMGRLVRPIVRMVRVFRIMFRLFLLSLASARAGIEGTMPITTTCTFLYGVLEYEDGILRYLVNARQPDLFKSLAVRAMLEFKWKRYARAHHLRNFAIFLLYAFIWTVYSALVYMRGKDSIERKYKDMLGVILLCFGCWYVGREMAKLVAAGFVEYVSSGWNLLNLVTNSTLIVVIGLEVVDAHSTKSRDLAAVVTPFMWLNCFNYLRGFRGTGALVRMIMTIIHDIRFFLLIMVIMTVAFTQAFFILEDPEIAQTDRPWEIAWQVYNTAWLGAQWTWYTGPMLQRLIYLFMTFFQLVVLMNLLIAIMGDTFARVMEGAIVEFYRNFAQLIYELEVLMTPRERRNTNNFPHYFLFSRKDMFEEVGSYDAPEEVAKADDAGIRSTLDQIRVEIKTLQRNTTKLVETAVDAADRSDNGSPGARRQQFHV